MNYESLSGRNRFYVPPNLKEDFSSFLNNNLKNIIMNFYLYKDWYEQFNDGYKETIIRGEVYPNSTKSRYQNTDNNINFRADLNSGIEKGDIVKDENNNIYLLDWYVLRDANNSPSRALVCNSYITFERYKNEVVDDMGYLISEAKWLKISEDCPCNIYRYDGRPEFGVSSNSAGVTPNALCICSLQYNSKTKDINIDDEFTWGNSRYIVIDVNYMGLNINGTKGIISIQAKKASGGEIK